MTKVLSGPKVEWKSCRKLGKVKDGERTSRYFGTGQPTMRNNHGCRSRCVEVRGNTIEEYKRLELDKINRSINYDKFQGE